MEAKEFPGLGEVKIGAIMYSQKDSQKVTVIDFTTSNRIACCWFDENGNEHIKILSPQYLSKI
jgi:hypothetical protein